MADLLTVAGEQFDDLVGADLGQFGEAITHWPAGVAANAATVQGSLQIGATEKLEDKGRGYVTRAQLFIADDVTVTTADRWVHDGTTWNTERNGKTEAGGRTVYLVKVENESRSSSGRARGGR